MPDTIQSPRIRALTGLYVIGCAGALAELLLTGHYEGWEQWIPLVALAVGLATGVLWYHTGGKLARRALMVTGWALAGGGVLGNILHLKGNREFELEMYPDLSGVDLVVESVTGATPVLAPGALVLLGLLAVILTHPRFSLSNRPQMKATLTILAILLVGCGGNASEEAPASAAPASAPVAAITSAPLNANLAGEETLAASDLISTELAAAIVAGRPYQSALDLEAVVAATAPDLDRAELYTAVWIPLNLNTASRGEILLTPGVGDRMAHEFEEYRPYVAMAQFKREMGKYVDEAEVERMSQYVYVPIDLNTASAEEILAIPGVGERMKHEFEEYRPYVSLDQFRREMGKYVDDDEVARLARYVEIRN